MKKALTVFGIVMHVVSGVSFVLYEQILFTRPSIFVLGVLAMLISFVVYYAEAAWSFNDCTNAFNILKLVYVLMSIVFAIAFLAVLFAARDGLEFFYCSFAVYYLLLLVLEFASLLKKRDVIKEE